MQNAAVTEQEVLAELKGLEPSRWPEVLDFIGYLRQRSSGSKKLRLHSRELTARELLDSKLVGLWADREDLGDSAAFARQLRARAEQRGDS